MRNSLFSCALYNISNCLDWLTIEGEVSPLHNHGVHCWGMAVQDLLIDSPAVGVLCIEDVVYTYVTFQVLELKL
jgi:hypothetical protein